jgi:peptide/nickel transport system ATP-binding protein
MNAPLLSVRISVDYPGKPGALEDVAFEIAEGEAYGLAGASGAGKSTIALSILRLIASRGARVRGSILFQGRDLLRLPERELRRIRGRHISLVMQSPASALNPVLRLESQLREAWQVHGQTRWRSARPQVQALLRRMGLDPSDSFLRRYPAEISVGQAQRIVIAMAVLHHPSLIVADEPTSALDPGSRQEVLELLGSLTREFHAAILYISHDLAAMAALCTRTGLLRDGRLLEAATAASRDAPIRATTVRECPGLLQW